MQHNILITSAGKRVALTRYFKETLRRFFPDAKVYTTDKNPVMAPAGYVSDECIQVPVVTAAEYPALLLQLCIEHEIGMVIPTIDTELILLAEEKSLFEERGIHLIVSNLSLIQLCRDKRNTGAFLEQHGIRVPKEIDKYHPTFPLFAKPYDGSLSKNLHYIQHPEELTPEILEDPKLLFMEYIDKNVYKEFTVDMYYGKDHRAKCIIPRERIEIRAGEINKGRTVKGYLLDYLKARLDKLEGCIGCICIQLFYDERTEDVVGIEINPRFGGGYPLSYMAGGNFPEWLIREYFLGETLAYSEAWKEGLLMLRFDDAIYIG